MIPCQDCGSAASDGRAGVQLCGECRAVRRARREAIQRSRGRTAAEKERRRAIERGELAPRVPLTPEQRDARDRLARQRPESLKRAREGMARSRARLAANPEQLAEFRRKDAAARAARLAANPELRHKNIDDARAWREKYPERHKASMRRRALARAAVEFASDRPGGWTHVPETQFRIWREYRNEMLPQLVERQAGKCGLCGKRVDLKLPGTHADGPQVDHVERLADGGLLFPGIGGLRLVHLRCNAARSKVARAGQLPLFAV